MKGRIIRPLTLCWMQDALLVTHGYTASHCNVSTSANSVTVGPCCQVSKSKSSRRFIFCASFGVRALQYPIQTLTDESIAWIVDSFDRHQVIVDPQKNCSIVQRLVFF